MTATTAVKEHPILFSGEMVRALLAKRKTRTRRLSERWMKVKAGDKLWVRETWRPYGWREDGPIVVQFRADGSKMADRFDSWAMNECDYESWYEGIAVQATDECEKTGLPKDADDCYYWPNGECPLKWRPSIFMPRWCSRITLIATADARREPLQDITENEAEREGIWSKWYDPIIIPCTNGDTGETLPPITLVQGHDAYYYGDAGNPQGGFGNARQCFSCLWSTLHTKPGERWEDNPDVTVLSFEVAQ